MLSSFQIPLLELPMDEWAFVAKQLNSFTKKELFTLVSSIKVFSFPNVSKTLKEIQTQKKYAIVSTLMQQLKVRPFLSKIFCIWSLKVFFRSALILK